MKLKAKHAMFVLLIAIILVVAVPTVIHFNDHNILLIERNCLYLLKALGQTELSYADSILDKEYVRWPTLERNGLVAEGSTRKNLIKHYNLAIFKIKPNTWVDTTPDASFTIIAVPYANNFGLRTFAIDDNPNIIQLRMWIGDSDKFHEHAAHLNHRDYWIPCTIWSIKKLRQEHK